LPSLKRKSEFQHLREQGLFSHITHWLAVSSMENQQKNLRWAWTLSRKTGNAVTRNRLKRWGREELREFDKNEIDINFIFKIQKKEFYKNLSREEFNKSIRKAFGKVS
jgi:ribonuclease P protein component